MQESVINLGAFGFWIFLAVVVAGGMWTHMRKLQLRKDLIQSLLEQGRPVDIEEVNRLLEPHHFGNHDFNFGPQDPRSPYRLASFIFFLAGFVTLFVAFRQDPANYWLVLLAALPLYYAAMVWHTCNKEYADGSLATLKHKRDPREPWQHGGGWFFWIGYATVFVGVMRPEVNIPLVVMGAVAIVIANRIWDAGNREFAQGRIPVHAPEPDTKPE
jgi:hypothetical protein